VRARQGLPGVGAYRARARSGGGLPLAMAGRGGGAPARKWLLVCVAAAVLVGLVGLLVLPDALKDDAPRSGASDADRAAAAEQSRERLAATRLKQAEERRARRSSVTAQREAARNADPPAERQFPVETGPLTSGHVRPLLVAGSPAVHTEALRAGLLASPHMMPAARAGHDAPGVEVLGRSWTASALASENKQAELRSQYLTKLPKHDDKRMTSGGRGRRARALPALVVDASPAMLGLPFAPENARCVFGADLESMRLVVLLRDPVQRMAAHYAEMRVAGKDMAAAQERSVYNVRSRSFVDVVKDELAELDKCRNRYAESANGWWYDCMTRDVQWAARTAYHGVLWNSLYGEMVRAWYCEVIVGGGPGCFEWGDARHTGALATHRQNYLMSVDADTLREHPTEVVTRILSFSGLPTEDTGREDVEGAVEGALAAAASGLADELPSLAEVARVRKLAATVLAEDREHLEALMGTVFHRWTASGSSR